MQRMMRNWSIFEKEERRRKGKKSEINLAYTLGIFDEFKFETKANKNIYLENISDKNSQTTIATYIQQQQKKRYSKGRVEKKWNESEK